MKITIETTNDQEVEKVLTALQMLKPETVTMSTSQSALPITKGNKTIDPLALFGIWKDSPRDLASIRKEAWERK